MVSAKEAFKQTYFNYNFKNLLDKIESEIESAIADSKFDTTVECYQSADKTVYQQIIKYLEELGYKVSIMTTDKTNDIIEISWKEYDITDIN